MHLFPQKPQLLTSVFKSRQKAPQAEKPALHPTPHVPALQVPKPFAVPGQTWPQVPQLLGSVASELQTFPTLQKPALH
jgi:hypothetical protein